MAKTWLRRNKDDMGRQSAFASSALCATYSIHIVNNKGEKNDELPCLASPSEPALSA